MRELHAIQRDLIIILAGVDSATPESIKQALDDYYIAGISHQKFQYHLQELASTGCVQCNTADAATTYALTAEGTAQLRQHTDWKRQYEDLD